MKRKPEPDHIHRLERIDDEPACRYRCVLCGKELRRLGGSLACQTGAASDKLWRSIERTVQLLRAFPQNELAGLDNDPGKRKILDDLWWEIEGILDRISAPAALLDSPYLTTAGVDQLAMEMAVLNALRTPVKKDTW